MKDIFTAFSLGISFLLLAGMTLALEPGRARGQVVAGSGFIEGDPGDGLGDPGAIIFGDPTDGLGVLGDPRDGLDCPNLFGDPGDGMDLHSLEFNGDPDDGLDWSFGDPEDGLDYLVFLHWVWIP